MRRPAPSSLDVPLLPVAVATLSFLRPRSADHQASIRTLDDLALGGRCTLRSMGVGCCNLLVDLTLAGGQARYCQMLWTELTGAPLTSRAPVPPAARASSHPSR